MPYLNQEIARLEEEKQRMQTEGEAAERRRLASTLSALDFSHLSPEEKKLAAGFFLESILISGETS